MVLAAGTSYNVLARYRTAIVALLAVETALHMWGANVALNLTGVRPAKPSTCDMQQHQSQMNLLTG